MSCDQTWRAASQQLAVEYSSYADEYDGLWSPVILPMGLPLLRALQFPDASSILDIGVGTGALLPHLRTRAPTARVFGVDYSEGMLQVAQQKGEWFLSVMDAQQLGIRTASFDVAVLMFILFHLPSPQVGLAETARVLRSGGAIGMPIAWVKFSQTCKHQILNHMNRITARPGNPRQSHASKERSATIGFGVL